MATHSIYDILDRLAERVTWPSDTEKMQVLASIDEARKEAALGVRVTEIACAHEVIQIRSTMYGPTGPVRIINKCAKCGKENIQ